VSDETCLTPTQLRIFSLSVARGEVPCDRGEHARTDALTGGSSAEVPGTGGAREGQHGVAGHKHCRNSERRTGWCPGPQRRRKPASLDSNPRCSPDTFHNDIGPP
jgi:hypothetical protein